MNKEINGKRITLSDDAMDLFELAMIGAKTRKRLENLVTTELDLPEYTRNMVEYFCASLRKLPDILMAASCTLKYAVVAREMKRQLEKERLFVPRLIPCNHGVLVVSASQMHIVLQERTWALAANVANDKVTTMDADQLMDIDFYKDDSMYRFFKHIDTLFENGQRMKNTEFIQFALPELASVCTTENILRWEISKLFINESYSDAGESKLTPGYIYDLNSGKNFQIQMFWTGQTVDVTKSKVMVIDMRGNGYKDDCEKKKVFDYNVNVISPSGLITVLNKSKALFAPIAEQIKKEADTGKCLANIALSGLIYDNYLLVKVEDSVYAGKLGQPLVTLGSGINIINLDGRTATIAVDKTNQINLVNVRTIINYDIDQNTSKIAAKLFNAL